MRLALAAELNGYPGSIHAIELAEQLHLSSDEVNKLSALVKVMKAECAAAMIITLAWSRILQLDPNRSMIACIIRIAIDASAI